MHILITAGPTREYFDSVRFISNPSTGIFGYEIAAEAARRGHRTTLVSGPVQLASPMGVTLVGVVSAAEMYDAAVAAFEDADVAIMTAAVCDYRPARRLGRKLKKKNQPRDLHLVPTRDICTHFGRIKKKRVVIGFAMEDANHHANAERKLRSKRCDAIVLNGIGNLGPGPAEIELLLAPDHWRGPYRGVKQVLARRVLKLVDELRRNK